MVTIPHIHSATATDTRPAICRTERPTFFMYGERMTSGTREIRLVIRGELVSQSSQGKKKLSTFVGNNKISGGGGGRGWKGCRWKSNV